MLVSKKFVKTKNTRRNKGETCQKEKERLFGMKTGARRGVLRET
jgi:hypothetical protein